MKRATFCPIAWLPGRLTTIAACTAAIFLLVALTTQPALAATSSKVAANLDQCRNGPLGGEVPCVGATWVNGNAGASNAHYVEGDSISYRMVMTGFAPNSSHTLIIQWDTTKGSKHAIDYITTWNRTAEAGSDACSDVLTADLCSTANTNITAIPLNLDPALPWPAAYPYPLPNTDPADPNAKSYDENFYMWGGTINSGGVTFGTFTSWTGDTSQQVTITFTASNPTVVLAWGGHIAKRQEWGAPIITGARPLYDDIPYTGTAANISGSPYHMRLISLDGSGGNQDRSLSAAAVTSPSSITINKVANVDSATGFPFTFSPALSGTGTTGFTLYYLGDSTHPNSMPFYGITNFITYTVTESIPTNWQLNIGACATVSDPTCAIGCSLSPISLDYPGPIWTTTNSTASVAINLQEGDDVTCIFYDKQQAGSIKVVKNTTGGDGTFNFTGGGTGVSSSFQLITSSGTASTTFSNLAPGSGYSVSETVPSGWSLASATCDNGNSVSNITVSAGQTVTCTFSNTKQASLTVVKNTTGGDGTFSFTGGGSGVSTSFNLTTSSGTASTTFSNLTPGSGYSVAETVPAGWELTSSSCDNGSNPGAITLAAGATVTCTFANRKKATLVVVKNTTGGDGTFNFTGGGTGVSSSFQLATSSGTASTTFSNLTPGSGYSVSETVPSGWSLTSATCDNSNSVSNITVSAGQTVTCTFSNTKQASLTVVKSASGADGTFSFTGGGSGVTSSFNLTTSGGSASRTFSNLAPGSGYSLAETVPAGWVLNSSSCDNGNSPSSITLAAGAAVTCTFNNGASPNLSISKTAGASSIHPGDIASYTITVTNTGPGIATGVAVTDTLPTMGEANWTVSATTGGLTCDSPLSGTPATGLSCSVASLGVGSASVTVQATVPSNYLLPPSLPAADSSLDNFEIDGDLVAGSGTDWATLAAANLIKCIAPGDSGNVGCDLDLASGQNDNSFGNGTKEDTAVPSVVTGSIPNNKSDLTRLYLATHAVTDGTTYLSNFLYVAWERVQAPKGSVDMDFELNQLTTLSSNGVTPQRTGGDLLITYDLDSGGTVPNLGYHFWADAAFVAHHPELYPNPSASAVCASSTSFPCWDKGSAMTVDVVGAVNSNQSVEDPILASGQTSSRFLDPLTFGEVKINLQKVAIFPINLSDPSQCTAYGQAYLKSRSSTSFTSALKDFIAPVRVKVSNCPDKTLSNTAAMTVGGVTVYSNGNTPTVITVSVPPPTTP